jgi:hypothetical protein
MSDKVTVKIIKGSVSTWKDGNFKKGDVFETTREEALKIDPTFIQILEDLPTTQKEEKPALADLKLEEPKLSEEPPSKEELSSKPRRVKHA